MAALLTSSIDTNLAVQSFFGVGNQTAWNALYPWLNLGNTLANAQGGATIASTFLTTSTSQAFTSGTLTDVTALNVNVVIPNGAFELRITSGLIQTSAVGVAATIYITDNAASPATYYAAYVPPGDGINQLNVGTTGVLPIPAGVYTPGTTVNFKVRLAVQGTGTVTVWQGVLIYNIQTCIRAVTA